MFRASLCPSSGEQRPCVTAYGVLRWFCWMWLVAVVGALRCRVRALCPKHVETEVDNKHMIVASYWFSLSSHFAHDARSQEPIFIGGVSGKNEKSSL